MEIACYSLLLEKIANSFISKMSGFKMYTSETPEFINQAYLNVDNSYICLYGGFFEIDKNE